MPASLIHMEETAVNQTDPGFFQPTIWSTILKVQTGSEKDRQAAWNRLLQRYRLPIICEIERRRRCNRSEAEDLAHEFIADGLRRDFLGQVSASQGRFRTFVKACLKHFLRDVHLRETALKRGGGQKVMSLDEEDEDGHRLIEPAASGDSPSDMLDKAWAQEILMASLAQLCQECEFSRRGSLFEALRPFLGGETSSESYRTLSARLGMTESAIKKAVQRLRQRLGEIIAEEVRQTVGSQEDWREELRYLAALLGR